MLGRALLVLAVIGIPLAARAESMPEKQRKEEGQALSMQLCSSCHAIGADGKGSDAAPSFVSTAAARDESFLRGFLAKPHGDMPPADLTNDRVDAIIAYILSLKK